VPAQQIERIDPLAPTPPYRQIAAIIKRRIQSGQYPPNTRIPTESELVETYEVARLTSPARGTRSPGGPLPRPDQQIPRDARGGHRAVLLQQISQSSGTRWLLVLNLFPGQASGRTVEICRQS
jgi:hypothetical protein